MKIRVDSEMEDCFWLDSFEINQKAFDETQLARALVKVMKVTEYDPETIVEELVRMVLFKADVAALLETMRDEPEDDDESADEATESKGGNND